MMINWKGFGRKRSWCNFKILYFHSSGGTEKNHEKTSISIDGLRGQESNPGPPEYYRRGVRMFSVSDI
jgi:hypothetical protein